MAASRSSGKADALRRERDRIRIAQGAARLIAEHGLTDWTLAKRKAARQLMLPETAGLPSNDEIEAALADHHALFGGDAHADRAASSARRGARLDAPARPMGAAARRRRRRRLGERAQRRPARAGRRRSEVGRDRARRRGLAYAALPPRAGDTAAHLRIDSARAAIRLASSCPSSGATALVRTTRRDSMSAKLSSCSRATRARRPLRTNPEPPRRLRGNPEPPRAELARPPAVYPSDGNVSRFPP